jgi:branched-chain amino acid transport system ATP-binding protein
MLALDTVGMHFGGVTALRNVSLSVQKGETLGLVGPNGAGKTTLFNVISGVFPPTAGSIVFDGQPLGRAPNWKRARQGIGRTFQVPQPMHELTVRENLIVAQKFGAGKRDDARIDEILDLLGLTDKQHADAAHALALTERKALEVGKALAVEPRLLMLDEVLGGLETASKRAFTETLNRVRSRYDLTMIVIEHDIETITALCPRVAVLNFGELIADGTPDAVFSDPEVIRSYTGEDAA